MTYWNSTYGAGHRAGMSRSRIQRPGGTRDKLVIIPPACPFKGPWQVVARFLWWEGYYAGLTRSLNFWLEVRSAYAA